MSVQKDIKYTIKNVVLGQGAFGTVHLGTMTEDDGKETTAEKKIALKEIPKNLDNDAVKSLSNEISISSTLDNTNIVRMLEIVEMNNKKYLAYELCNGGDLRKYMHYFKKFDEELIQIIVIKMLNGLSELHKKNVIHHDIKPENILIHLFYDKEMTPEIEKKIEKVKEITKKRHHNKHMNPNNHNNNNNFGMVPNNYFNGNNQMPYNNNNFNQNMFTNNYFNNNIPTPYNNMINYNNYNNNFNYNTFNGYNNNWPNNNMNYMNQNNAFNNYNANYQNNQLIQNNTNFNNNNNMNFNTCNNNNMNYNNNFLNNNTYNNNQININNIYINNNNNNIMNINNNNNYNNNLNNNNNFMIPNNTNIMNNANNMNNMNNANNLNDTNNLNYTNNMNNNINKNNDIISMNEIKLEDGGNGIKDPNNKKNDNNKKKPDPKSEEEEQKKEVLEILKQAQFKLSDFGLSKLKTDIVERNLCGSPLYMAPELFIPETSLESIENFPVDVWALGVLVFEMFFGRRPFEAFSIDELSKMYKKGTYYINLEKNETISKGLFNFINMCLQKDPKKRANIVKLQESDFINQDIGQQKKSALNKEELIKQLGDSCIDSKNNIVLDINTIYNLKEK